MKKIVIIEDTAKDAEKIKELLKGIDSSLSCQITHLLSLREAKAWLSTQQPDLVILDLEFTEDNTTSINLLSDYLAAVPVIIVSHLVHYQRSLTQSADVRAFIRKDDMDTYLFSAVMLVLEGRSLKDPVNVIFPSHYIHGIDEAVPVQKIRYIEKSGRISYCVHFTDSSFREIKSVHYSDLLKVFKEQGILSLQPVSRNEIINTSCIKSIMKDDKGRLKIQLINLENHPFYPGTNYKDFFLKNFPPVK